MKHYIPPKSLVLFLLVILFNIVFSISNRNKNNNKISLGYTEDEAKTLSNFSKMVKCASKPLVQNCPQCINPGNGYRFFFFYQTTQFNKFNFKFMIHYNDLLKKILVSFSGPSVNEHIYIKYIYTTGFALVKRYRFQVEKEYYRIYFNKFRRVLKKKLKNLLVSGRKKFQVYFTGHSIGASLATLAAFDMERSKILRNVKVFAVAPLRLGDATYVAMVNSYITVYRIVRNDDYLVRIPNCYFSISNNMWRCFNQTVIKQYIYLPTFPLKVYLGGYLTYFTRTNTILRSAIVYARKRIDMNLKMNTNHNHKKILRKKEHKKNHGIAVRKNRSFSNNKKIPLMKKLMKILNQKVHYTQRNLKKFKHNPKKIQKSTRKISKELKKLKKINPRKNTFKRKINKLIKIENSMNKRTVRRNPVLFNRRFNKFFRNVRRTTRKFARKIKNIARRNSHLNKKNHTSKRKDEDTKKKLAKKKSEEKKLYPVKHFHKKHNPKNNIVKSYTYVPTPTTFKIYNPIQTYSSFVYYTQPIGYQIFYNDSMTTYTTCKYINGISLCEKFISLPLQFTTFTHMSYFGINFDMC
jgi:hypothetical protein